MNIHVLIVTYNGMGGHPVLSYIGHFLLLDAPESFGSAIAMVDIYAHFQSNGPPKQTLERLGDRFRARLKTLPLVWFRRKKCLFEIAYFSKLGDAEEMFEKKSKPVSLSLFHDGCHEIVATLSMIRKRLNTADEFDYEAFDAHLQRRLSQLPTSISELKKLLGEIKAIEQQQIAARAEAVRLVTEGQQMPKGGPKAVALDHDDYTAEYVGWTKNGRQFFLTTPFVPGSHSGGQPGREFLALYLFDKAGALLSATIDDLGPRASLNETARIARRDEMLASLGEVEYRRIKVAPFKVERFGVEFGFIPQPPEEEGGDWSVIVEPGNYMCFWPPWTSGDYDT